MRAYKKRCAVTGTALEQVLEAAHVLPYNGPRTNHIQNGLLLRSDIHALFDLGLLSIDPKTMTVYCSKSIRSDALYGELHGARLRLPALSRDKPSVSAIASHFAKRVP